MTTTYINPLDLRLLINNYLLGTQTLFTFVFVILLSYVAAKYQMSTKVFLVLFVMGSLMFFTYIGESMLLVILVIVGFVSFKAFSKLVT